MMFRSTQRRAAMAAIAVTLMAALAHYALAGGMAWPAPAVFGILLPASWAVIAAAFKVYGGSDLAPAFVPAGPPPPEEFAGVPSGGATDVTVKVPDTMASGASLAGGSPRPDQMAPEAAAASILERLNEINLMIASLPPAEAAAAAPRIAASLAGSSRAIGELLTGAPAPVPDVGEYAARDHAERIVQEIRAYVPLFDKVSSEAESVSATTEEAAKFLLTQLRDVDQTISALLEFLEGSGSNEKVVALIQHIEEHLDRNRQILTAFLEHRNRDIEDSKRRLNELETITSSLATAAQGVRGIASRITMLSMNATIEAARAGDAGRGFAVVAAEVKALSHQSDKAAADIRSGLERLGDAMKLSMSAMIEKSVESQRADMEEITTAVTDLSENLERLVTHQRDVLTKVHAEGQKIAHPIIEMMGSIQFQDVTRQRLQGLGEAFSHAKTHLGQLEQAVTNLPSGAELPEFVDVNAEARNCLRKTESTGPDTKLIELF
jgi:hypothetical protein